MNGNDDTGIPESEAHLVAENESLKDLLHEYEKESLIKKREQFLLQQQANEGAAFKSNLDNRLEELARTKNYVSELMQQAEGAAQREKELEKQLSVSVSTQYQLDDIRVKYNHLQAQLDDMIGQLRQIQSRQILQQQDAGRIAELESLLANAEAEIALLKNSTNTEN